MALRKGDLIEVCPDGQIPAILHRDKVMMQVMIKPDMERTPTMDMMQAMSNRPDLEAIEAFNPLH